MTEEKSLQYRGLKAFEKTERLLEILEAQLNSTTCCWTSWSFKSRQWGKVLPLEIISVFALDGKVSLVKDSGGETTGKASLSATGWGVF